MNDEQLDFIKSLMTAPEARQQTVHEFAVKIQAKYPEISDKDAEACVVTSAFMIALGVW